MAEGEDFAIFQEDGKDGFQCNYCECKFTSQKSIRTHITVKHKAVKATKKQPTEEKEPDALDGFKFSVTGRSISTQIQEGVVENPEKTTEDIIKEYEDQNMEGEEIDPEKVTEIPDDTMDQVIANMDEESNKLTEESVIETPKTDEEIIKMLKEEVHKLKEYVKTKEKKLEESESNVLNSQIEVSNLTEELHQRKTDMKIKDYHNIILLGERNSLEYAKDKNEARLSKLSTIIHKIYKEKEVLKAVIEKQKTTIDFLQNKSPSATVLSNSAAGETIKKLNETVKNRTEEIDTLKATNKTLIEELSEVQDKTKRHEVETEGSDKFVKLSKVVSSKSKEITDLRNENKSLKEKCQDLTSKTNEVSQKVTALEIRNTRLDTQVENLIEALGKKDSKEKHEKPNDSKEASIKENPRQVKCRHNDKAICLRQETCQYVHNKYVCSNYSRFGSCEREEICPNRHPTGICNRWKRGVCEKDGECFYRHPLGEESSSSRKRTLSNQQMFQNNKTSKTDNETHKSQDDQFLFSKMMELEKKYQSL